MITIVVWVAAAVAITALFAFALVLSSRDRREAERLDRAERIAALERELGIGQ